MIRWVWRKLANMLGLDQNWKLGMVCEPFLSFVFFVPDFLKKENFHFIFHIRSNGSCS